MTEGAALPRSKGPRAWLERLGVTLVRMPALPRHWRLRLFAQWDPLLRQITLFEGGDLGPRGRVGAFLHELVHVLHPEMLEGQVQATSESWLRACDEAAVTAWDAELVAISPLVCPVEQADIVRLEDAF